MKNSQIAGYANEKGRTKLLRSCFVGLFLLLVCSSTSSAQTVTKIVDNGADGNKLVFAILGDGYGAADQSKYVNDIFRLVLNGILGHDFYRDNQRAFNVYRVDLISRESGISTPGTTKDTALKMVYSGDWNSCWMEESADTDSLINQALGSVPKYDYVLVMLNEKGWGGCRRGSRLYVTSGDNQGADYWAVVAHEYGHGIGSLFDEYFNPGNYAGPTINTQNCSTVLNRTAVIWRGLILSGTSVPTTFSTGMDSNQTVGMFQGCSYKATGIYRPVENCRMRSNIPLFCPVCLGLMNRAVSRYLRDDSPSAIDNNPVNVQNSATIGRTKKKVRHRLTGSPQRSISSPTASLQVAPRRESYIQMVIKVRKNGDSEVIKATEVQGTLMPQVEPVSNYIYEITDGGRTLSAEFLPEDPFVVRGFNDPNSNQGELLREAETATIVVKMPKTDLLDSPQSRLSLRLYQIRPGTTVERLDALTLNRLKTQRFLTPQVSFTADKLGPAIRQKITRLPQ